MIYQAQNRYLDFLIDRSFWGVNRLFVLLFKNDDDDCQESQKRYSLPTVGIKDYEFKIDGRNIFDQPIRNDFKKDCTGQGDDCTTRCLLDYPCFKKISQYI